MAYLERDKYEYESYEFKYKEAIGCLDTAIKSYEKKASKIAFEESGNVWRTEDCFNMYNNLGICYYELQDYDKAIGCFEKALGIAKDSFFPTCLAEHNMDITCRKINSKLGKI